MATHSSILAWRISWTEELWATVHGVAKSQKQLKQLNTGTHTHTHTYPSARGLWATENTQVWAGLCSQITLFTKTGRAL